MEERIIFLACFVLLLSSTASALAMKGDCNYDNDISSVDALIALRMSIGLVSEDPIADIDLDGAVRSHDAYSILLMALDLEPEYDVYGDLALIVSRYNRSVEKDPYYGVLANERINFIVSLNDGNTLLFGTEVDKDSFAEYPLPGGVNDPTIRVYASESTVHMIAHSKSIYSSFGTALENEDVIIESAHGSSLKIDLLNALRQI